MKVAFILLCSRDAKSINTLCELPYFNNKNNKLYIHYDLTGDASVYTEIVDRYKQRKDIHILQDRVQCEWGAYSLVDATKKLMETVLADSEFQADYVYLISESCFPIKNFDALQRFLNENPMDFIEAVDPTVEKWAVGGFEMDRLTYSYPFNFKTQRKLFELYKSFQQKNNLKRTIPSGLAVHFGSQWMCIRRETASYVVSKLSEKPLEKFLRGSWIPDEFAIHSIIASKIPVSEIANLTLTYIEFNEEGLPIVFYNDSVEHLANQPFFFARKRSMRADTVIEDTLAASEKTTPPRNLGEIVKYPNYKIFISQVKNNRPPVGGIENTWWHPVDRIDRQYYCVSGISRRYIREILRKMGSWGHQRTHGYLFSKTYIDILSDDEYRYSHDDLAIRNYAPLPFLYDQVMRDSKDTVFAFDWNDLDVVRNRIVYHDLCNVVLIDPPFNMEWEKLVFRLSFEEVVSILNQPASARSDALHTFFKGDDIGFWRRLSQEGHNCRLHHLNNAPPGIADGLRAAAAEINIEDVFEPEYFELLHSISRN